MQEEEKKTEEKELSERQRIAEEKSKSEKKFEVKFSFLGEYTIEIEADSFADAALAFEGETREITEENLSERLRLDIGNAEINERLDIDVSEIVSIEAD